MLIVFALWSWLIWLTLVKNIANDPRSWGPDSGGPTGFLVVHVVLAVISLAFGTAIGRLGWRGLRAARRQTVEAGAGAAEQPEPVRTIEL